MILNFDEVNPQFGNVPYNDGTFWRSVPRLIYNQITPTTLTAAASASVITTTSAKGNVILPAGFLNSVGRTIQVDFGGYLTTAGSGQGNLSFFAQFVGASTYIVSTTAAANLVASQAKIPFFGQLLLTTTLAGTSGTLQTSGAVHLYSNSAVLDPCFANASVAGTLAPQTPTAFDLTQPYTIDLQATLSTAVNTLVVTNVLIRSLWT